MYSVLVLRIDQEIYSHIVLLVKMCDHSDDISVKKSVLNKVLAKLWDFTARKQLSYDA